MPVPTITQPSSPRIIPVDTAFSLQLSASESPTSWSMSSGPSGLSINSSGLISGTPTAANTVSSASITATNGTGTSTAVTLIFVIADTVAGLAQGSFALPIDWDLNSGRLSVPGVDDIAWKADQQFPLSIGFKNAGVLQEIGVEALSAWLKNAEDESAVELTLDATALTATGTDATARIETTIAIPGDGLLAAWLEDGNLTDATGEDAAAASFFGSLELVATKYNDARDYSEVVTGNVGNFTASQTKNNTLFAALDETWPTAYYELALEYLSPSDTAMQGNLTVANATVTYSGGSYAISGALPSNVTANATPADQWDVTLSIQSLSANATGISVAARAVSDSDGIENRIEISDAELTISGGNITLVTSPKNLELFQTGTSMGNASIATGDSAATIKSAIQAAIGGGLTISDVQFNGNTIETHWPDVSTIDTIGTDWGNFTISAYNDARTLTDCSWRLTVTGLPDSTAEQRRRSLSLPVTIVRDLGDD